MNKTYLFLVTKNITVADILQATGIRRSNFWFEFFLSKFKTTTLCCDLQSIVVHLSYLKPQLLENTAKLITHLNDEYDINDDFFLERNVFVFNTDLFVDVDFEKITARKIKIIQLRLT